MYKTEQITVIVVIEINTKSKVLWKILNQLKIKVLIKM